MNLHSLRVACRFWPWDRRFMIGLLHDAIEDGWISFAGLSRIDRRLAISVNILSRDPDDETYAEYIQRLTCTTCPEEIDVKRADLLDNYRRCKPSLRKRYARALYAIDGGGSRLDGDQNAIRGKQIGRMTVGEM